MSHDNNQRGAEVIADASKRLDDLRVALPDTTRGMFEFSLMLHLLEKAMPQFVEWATGDLFMEHFTAWVAMGCPEFAPDAATEMFAAFQNRKWTVN